MTGPNTNWGHPVAYHPMLAHFFGSVNAAIFFGQLRYWSDRTENPLGVYKTSEEWAKETGLSYREQVTARRVLSEPGFVVETNKRLEHRLFFLIDWGTFNPAFEAWLDENPPSTKAHAPNCANRNSPNDENAFRGERNRRSSISTETTAETTAKETPAAPAAPPPPSAKAPVDKPAKPVKKAAPGYVETYPLPDWIDRDHWNVWRDQSAHRKATDAQKKLVVAKLEKWRAAGIDAALALENSATNGWQGLFQPDHNSPVNRTATRQDQRAATLAGLTDTGENHDHNDRPFYADRNDHNTFDADARFID